MIIVSLFKLKYNTETGIYTIISFMASKCPLCGGGVYYRDSKARGSKNLHGEERHFSFRRLRCEVCKKLHNETPDIIQPFKHYDSATIQSVLDGSEDAKGCAADNATIHRWKSSFAKSEPDIAQRVASVYGQETDEVVPLAAPAMGLSAIKAMCEHWLAFVMGLLINNGHKICTQFAFCPLHNSDIIQNVRKNCNERGRKSDKAITDTS